ncbi:arabinogalactan oligomer/maltooligosaccharide transport system permease protein [Alkalihalobacillus xiaoxiensis]|uniref:Maltose/maltodextrin transport system permease protein n=1 Tax=Shouchella xiaoxiensis TaxID=766895 RepID=A0ABS2SYJ1_9BACI|nr:arabinogalactan oligomer/maltooligosaccharide transport system permease protein [Shouchella xiaoxiensis]
MHARRSMLLSILFMGFGQFYNRQLVKGLLFVSMEIYLIAFWTLPFRNAMWGLYTLGESVQTRVGFTIVPGDHSIFLMIEGIIFLICGLLFLWMYYLNIRDARRVGFARDQGIAPNKFKKTLLVFSEKGFPYFLLMPSVVFTSFLTILPLIFGIAIAFTNYSAPNHIPPASLVDWVGFQTFIDLFNMKTWNRTFIGVFSWTFVWAILATVTTFFTGMFFAVLLNSKGIRFQKFWRSIYILPWAIPSFVSILIMRNLFNGEFGPINQYLDFIGLAAVPWLSDPNWAKFTLVVVNIWFGFPFWMVLMSGVMTSIDRELYDASQVDGANARQQFRKITLPIVMFSTAPLLIMQFAGNFNNFNLIYLLTQGGPVNVNYSYAGSTDILISWIYKLTLDQSQFAMASVVSILIFIALAGISIWNFRRTRAFKEEDTML